MLYENDRFKEVALPVLQNDAQAILKKVRAAFTQAKSPNDSATKNGISLAEKLNSANQSIEWAESLETGKASDYVALALINQKDSKATIARAICEF